jgi:hypothetical protein
MEDEIPKWPESLPPPFEMTRGPREHHLTAADLEGETNINDLIHDLYWFPDDLNFIYFRHGEGLGKAFISKIEKKGIEVKKTELYFYRHPKPAYQNDYIRILPHENVPNWQKEAANGPMFGRVLVTLKPARRKQIDFYESARITIKVIADNESLIEAKPNFFGLGVNLNSLLRKALKWLRHQ